MRISMMRFPDSAECARGVNVYTVRCMQIRYRYHTVAIYPESDSRPLARLGSYLSSPRDVVAAIRRYRLRRAGLTASIRGFSSLKDTPRCRCAAPRFPIAATVFCTVVSDGLSLSLIIKILIEQVWIDLFELFFNHYFFNKWPDARCFKWKR